MRTFYPSSLASPIVRHGWGAPLRSGEIDQVELSLAPHSALGVVPRHLQPEDEVRARRVVVHLGRRCGAGLPALGAYLSEANPKR